MWQRWELEMETRVYQTDKFIFLIGMAPSISAAKRLREAGAVEIDGTRITTPYIIFHGNFTRIDRPENPS